VLWIGGAFGQIQSVTVKKGHNYNQTSATTVLLDSASNNFGFGLDVDGNNISGIAAPTVTGPVNTASLGTSWNGGVLKYSTGDRGWRGGANANDFGFATQAQADSVFANGTYNFNVSGNAFSLALVGDAYPNVPSFTLTGGAWANGKYVIDPAQPLTLTTNAFTGYGSHADDLLCIGVLTPTLVLPWTEVGPFGCGFFQARAFASSSPGTNTLTVTIPANTFVAGQEYPAIAVFHSIVDKKVVAGLPGSTNVAYYERATLIRIKAQSPIFPMTVNANIGPTVSNATANIQFRPQDVGTTGSVYTFFVAPSTKVVNALTMEKGAQLGMPPRGRRRMLRCNACSRS
jgi:hypothetical protein